ncbi:2-amino-4-hydroxy-6-hydroxymethyldihydropteridine diphosphokinase [Paenibacillus sp. SC116]|uniref:2-amino-4-hydroxy-6- hydroxymethyldihydropteridine diphosphokinase n=1 Tax=Paenibacillus sp. SC116 TaxID=2968986 RepID=UPI00215B5852|nr:2-amino-4-hydroxy-6-hydroxymethyldihydropteridine diphosphokinase [Paenibacillus sp. SC116]MCR8846613.1 2-amino-4-hydroxy-6-hydroxymethyldihydropteridine diphosphokinase [Paenibacillus sp. SC116]
MPEEHTSSSNRGWVKAFIALGANLGDRERTLSEGLGHLHLNEDVNVLHCSSLYETDPVGYVDQPAFLNMAAVVETRLSPEQLLDAMLNIEQKLGRVREIRWGPRTLDLDLLSMQGVKMETEKLILPHPRMGERLFVLVPLADIVTSSDELYAFVHDALGTMEGKEGIRLWKRIDSASEFVRSESFVE